MENRIDTKASRTGTADAEYSLIFNHITLLVIRRGSFRRILSAGI